MMGLLESGQHQHQQTLLAFLRLCSCGLRPEKAAFLSALSAAGALRNLPDGKLVHALLLLDHRRSDTALENGLLSMYGKCGHVSSARALFDRLLLLKSGGPGGDRQHCYRQWNSATWNAMIATYARAGDSRKALALFRQMGPAARTRVSFLAAFRACNSLSDGRDTHARLASSILFVVMPDVAVHTALLDMYGRCRCPEKARPVFDGMASRDLPCWNAMISAYAQSGHTEDATELFHRMVKQGLTPDKITFLSILGTYHSPAAVEQGRKIHDHIKSCGLDSDISLQNALINMYGKCSSLECAKGVFDGICTPNIVSWTAMIAAYAQNGHAQHAIVLFSRMGLEEKSLKPNRVTFLVALDACARLASLESARAIHEQVLASGLELDTVVNNALVNMYGKCGSTKDARLVFDGMRGKDTISWNSMIAACAHIGDGGGSEEALRYFGEMESEGVKPNRATFLSVLDACANLARLEAGRTVHKYIVANGLEVDVSIRTALVNMYGKCGSVEDAWKAFNGIHHRDIVAWNAMIAACARNDHEKAALELLRQMDSIGIEPDKITFVHTLDACSRLDSLELGASIHRRIVAGGYDEDVDMKNSLLNMYAKCGSLGDARAVFDEIHWPDRVSWNTMLSACVDHGYNKDAMELFWHMVLRRVRPDRVTFLSILEACANLASMDTGKVVHGHVCACGLDSDVYVRNALLSMYGKCTNLNGARAIFDNMRRRDVVSWNAMAATYVRNGYSEEALELFQGMVWEGVIPDRVTLLMVVNSCASLAWLKNAKAIHERISSFGFEFDLALNNALLDMYGKCGSVRDAWIVFEGMRQRDIVSWNAIIVACTRNGHGEGALQLFQQMTVEGVKPDKITFLAILNACSHEGLWDRAWNAFASMSNEYGMTPFLEHYVSMIDVLGRAGCLNEVEDSVRNVFIEHGAVTWSTLLGACRLHGSDMDVGVCVGEHGF